MDGKITGVLALIVLVVFLGNYLIKIGSLPLGAIIVAVLVMAVYDYIDTVRKDGPPGN